MVAVTRIIIPIAELPAAVTTFPGRFDRITFYFPKDPLHTKSGLKDTHVLIHAWKYVERPDRRKQHLRNSETD